MIRHSIFAVVPFIACLCASATEAPPSPLAILSQQAPNASAWVLAPLDEPVPKDIRQNLTFLREDLLDEGTGKSATALDAYRSGHQLCNSMLAALDERDMTLARAGVLVAQANANVAITSQALEARRSGGSRAVTTTNGFTGTSTTVVRDLSSWTQYAREGDQREELRNQANNKIALANERYKAEWTERVAQLRPQLDGLYAQFRGALRKEPGLLQASAVAATPSKLAKAPAQLPEFWTWHVREDLGPSGTIQFKSDGTIEQKISGRNTMFGTWKPTAVDGEWSVKLNNETSTMTVTGSEAVTDWSFGKRYLRVKAPANGSGTGSSNSSKATPVPAASIKPSDIKSAEDLTRYLMGSVWSFGIEGYGTASKLRFHTDKTCVVNRTDPVYPWQAIDARTVDRGDGSVFEFSEDYSSYSLAGKKNRYHGERLKEEPKDEEAAAIRTAEDLTRYLADSEWSWGEKALSAPSKLRFSRDGTWSVNDDAPKKKWKAVDARTVKCDDGTEMIFVADYTRYSGTSSLGNAREGARRAEAK